MNEPFAFYQQSADYVRARMPFEPQIAVILGSSLGPFAGQLQDPVEIDYHEIPNFLTSTRPATRASSSSGRSRASGSCACRAGSTAMRAMTSSS